MLQSKPQCKIPIHQIVFLKKLRGNLYFEIPISILYQLGRIKHRYSRHYKLKDDVELYSYIQMFIL